MAFANVVRGNNWSQLEIAKILGVDESVVYKDIAILREQSRGKLKNIFGKDCRWNKKIRVIGSELQTDD